MPQGAAQIIFLILTSLAVTWIPHSRVLAQIFNTLVSVVGMLLIWKLNPEEQVGRMVGLSIGIVYAINLPISLSIVTSNVAGQWVMPWILTGVLPLLSFHADFYRLVSRLPCPVLCWAFSSWLCCISTTSMRIVVVIGYMVDLKRSPFQRNCETSCPTRLIRRSRASDTFCEIS